jgi:hypothetical protein
MSGPTAADVRATARESSVTLRVDWLRYSHGGQHRKEAAPTPTLRKTRVMIRLPHPLIRSTGAARSPSAANGA